MNKTSTYNITENPIQKMELTSRNIDNALLLDSNSPKLIDFMNINPQNGSTASGFADHDYPTFSGVSHVMNHMTQIKCVNNVPLPSEIVDHFARVQCHCMMGLFCEINRAWLTVDSDIYVWTYEQNTDLAYFDGINETIVCVGLVKPKIGVFHSFIKYLLVLATSVDIIVLGVTFTENTDEIQLIPDPVFTLTTDGATVTIINSTEDGRIFYGTKEGNLFEISYQAESGWFGKRCKKINLSTSTLSFLVPSFLNAALSEEDGICQISIDESRHILYTLTEKGTIEVCDLGEKGTSFSKIVKMSQTTLVNQAMSTVKTLDSQNFRPIVSISAIEASESANLNLVAVSQTGVRFYLTVVSLSNQQPNQRPYTLTLAHVRLPPGYSANISVRPRAVHVSHYRDRNLVLISTVNEKDVLWCMSSDLFPFNPSLVEAYSVVTLDGPALAISEVRSTMPLQLPDNQEAPPLVVRQHAEPPKKYIVLTSHSVQIFIKLRPVDILNQILKDSHGQDTEALKTFFAIQKEDQACATCLILASLENEDNLEVAEYAARAFFLYGGEPKLVSNNMFSGTSFAPQIISTPSPHQFPSAQYQHQTISPTSTTYDLSTPFIFSAKHNGLYLYLSRILRPIWLRRTVDRLSLDGKNLTTYSTVTGDDCIFILNNLTALHNFLIKNTQLSATNTSQSQIQNVTFNNTSMNVTRMNHTIQDAQLEERMSLNALKIFVSHCCQILGLWRILCEHQFHSLIASLPENEQQILLNTSFKDLFLYKHDICSLLISALVHSYLGDNASVDSISSKLREVCPQLYRTEDVAFSKAIEILKMVRTTQNIDDKEEMIYSAVQICKSIGPTLNINDVCKELCNLKAYKAVIELCAHFAKKIDPDSIAENYYNSADNSGDQEGYAFYQERLEIYRHLLNMLDSLYTEQNQTRESSINYNYSNNQSLILDGKEESQAGYVINQVINDILDTPDEIMHISLYDWLVAKNMMGDLLKIHNSSLETYLKRTAAKNPNNIDSMDLLWKYYENKNNHAAAAKILNNLASRTGVNILFKERLSYLARAIMCMRSDKIGYAPYLGVFLRDLEDRMEVAKVQEQILNAIINLQGQIPNAQEAINVLNSGLYEISQLYENFAEPFKLLECQLAIIDCAGYTDQNLIESIWQQILTEELKKTFGTGTDKVCQLLNKVKQLAKQYAQSVNCFPLSYIVYELEIVNAKLKGDKQLVPTALESMNIPFESLINVYNNLNTLSVNDHFWQLEENEFHLSEAIAALINCFLSNYDTYNSIEKRRITSLCQDTVVALLSNLYSKPNTELLINKLKNIQAKLSRI
ncbi:nuclear pore complex protein Nup154 [Diorhabda sublineata]|uniref:nuclear pore complex protein Nup154 n=1 Tax=Diorhabda sublineata TaxID=1163346 RepID=UPI0024E13213|nr:nuclear pore complex protein Nup154 [Diorhabda sublineata]